MTNVHVTRALRDLLRDGLFIDGDWVESKDQDPNGTIRLTQLADVGETAWRDRSDRWMNEEQARRIGITRLLPGDVLVARMPDPLGRACLVPETVGRAATVVDVAILRPSPQSIDNRFLMYAVNSRPVRNQIELLQAGATRQRVSRKNLGRVQVPFTPLDEQRAIADYLDQETAQIDALVAKQEEFIRLLHERWSSLVTHEVMHAAPERSPLRRVVDVIDCAHVTADFVDDKRYPVASIRECQGATVDLTNCNYTTEEFYNHLRSSGRAPRVGDLLFIRNVSVGLVAEVAPGTRDFAVGQETVLLRRKSNIDPKFLRYALTGAEVGHSIENAMIGATFRRINVSAIRSLPVPVPSPEEQTRIATLLEQQTSRIDSLIAKAEEHIALAKERRSALITAAVTGQFDVRTARKAG
ncbi:restriction endonuclease subunit S [Citricoccus sp. NR2]|uniref:restriction endonuclease subunit S n=1 Tax=Citricoccus sp. NR2 TaxID=3004095 RepID=UPI0022DD89AE|nr:restriction endonuclease subunit S [Citricoccus sp. NR2]WBL20239.1 restriction endonuclease subunit S [Citricoccus sp. NR2]